MLRSHQNLLRLIKQVEEASEEGTNDLICDNKRGNYCMHSEMIICGMHTKQRPGKGNKDDITSYRMEI